MKRTKQLLRLMQQLIREILAEEENLPDSRLNEIEHRRVMPSLKAQKKLAAALKLPVTSLPDKDAEKFQNVGNIGTNSGVNFNNYGSNFGNVNLTANYCLNSTAAPQRSFTCPFAPHGKECDGVTAMIIASLPEMSAEQRHKLLLYAVELVE